MPLAGSNLDQRSADAYKPSQSHESCTLMRKSFEILIVVVAWRIAGGG
jgi:hypothetical protein